jgi:uncharacterized protein YfaS (alpha-2-macroglobulin family)
MPDISGHVSGERATPVGGITVELINSAGDIVDQVQVDDDGRFKLHVSPGTWKLSAYDPGGRRVEATTEVADEEAKVELVLT